PNVEQFSKLFPYNSCDKLSMLTYRTRLWNYPGGTGIAFHTFPTHNILSREQCKVQIDQTDKYDGIPANCCQIGNERPHRGIATIRPGTHGRVSAAVRPTAPRRAGPDSGHVRGDCRRPGTPRLPRTAPHRYLQAALCCRRPKPPD